MLLVLRLRRSVVWRHAGLIVLPLSERHWAVGDTPSRSRSTAGSGYKQVRSGEHRFPHMITALLAGLLAQQRVLCVRVQYVNNTRTSHNFKFDGVLGEKATQVSKINTPTSTVLRIVLTVTVCAI